MNTENEPSESQFENNPADRMVVHNAGAILLWPFLTRYFEELGLVEQGEFVHDEARNRAVYLLQYLVCFKTDLPENVLTLNKLLVGLSIGNRLTPISVLTEAEKDLSVSLLHGFIANWDKVRNTSIEGIQETFLLRQGMLTVSNTHDELSVENKGVDVLLTSLPWNISMINLPWMEKPLQVEWV
jgi:hypothetical protein